LHLFLCPNIVAHKNAASHLWPEAA
jgi:hypothetical protein